MHEMQPVMKVLMSNCHQWRKVFYIGYPIACLLSWLITFHPLVTCPRYLNNRVPQRKTCLVPSFVDWFSSAEKHRCEEHDFERVMAHLAKNGCLPYGANNATSSLLNHTNEDGKWICHTTISSTTSILRPGQFTFPNLLIIYSS